MKKFLTLALALMMVMMISLTACAETYTAASNGFGGPVTVTMEVVDGKITSVTVDAANETPTIGGAAADTVAAQIVDAQSADVDGVAGASLTSGAIKAAAQEILDTVNGVEKAAVEFADGTYTAVAPGFYGDFELTVVIEGGKIASVTAGDNAETPTLGGKAIAIMTADMVANNTANVDSVAGATLTSAAVRIAAMKIMSEIGAPAEMSAPVAAAERTTEEISTQVLVIGSGAAGYAAAITAKEAGADVLMIEKQGLIGGSTITSAGIVYAALDEDDIPVMIDYYMGRAYGDADIDQLTFFAQNSMGTKEWLTNHGVQWMFSAPAGTALQPRANFSMFVTGASLINPLADCAEQEGIGLMLNTRATELLVDETGAVCGAKASGKTVDYVIKADAVVLATGGFDASEEVKAEFTPIAVGDFPLSSKGNVGDGLKMGIAIGADTLFKNGSIGFIGVDGSLPNSGESGVGMGTQIFVAADGSYLDIFVDYPLYYKMMKENNLTQCWGLFDGEHIETAAPAVAAGFGCQADTLEELAALSGMDVANIQASIATAAENGVAFGDGPYAYAVIKPMTIGSMGGLVINTDAQVLKNGEPIKGLYASGEVANGGFYKQEYPASGSSISLAFTFGREAGANAAAEVLSK